MKALATSSDSSETSEAIRQADVYLKERGGGGRGGAEGGIVTQDRTVINKAEQKPDSIITSEAGGSSLTLIEYSTGVYTVWCHFAYAQIAYAFICLLVGFHLQP